MNHNAEKSTKLMNEYLMLDKDERVPFALSIQLLFCKKCRKQIKMLKIAEKLAAIPLKIQAPITDKTIENVMQNINLDEYRRLSKKPISFHSWVVCGIIMIVLLTFSISMYRNIDSFYLMTVYVLMFSGAVTIYCCLFVKNNIDFFVKKIATTLRAIEN